MKERTEKRILLGENLTNLAFKGCIKSRMLGLIAGVGETTINRLMGYDHNFESASLEKVLDVFGITSDEIYKLDIDKYTTADIQRRIEKFRNANRNDQISKADLKNHFKKFKGKTYHINELYKDGFFEEGRTVKEVNEVILDRFGAKYTPTDISNTLKTRAYLSSESVTKNIKIYKVKTSLTKIEVPKKRGPKKG